MAKDYNLPYIYPLTKDFKMVSMPNCTPPVCVALVFRVMHDLFVNRAYVVRRLGLFFVVGAPAPTPYWGGGAWGYCRRGGWSIRTKLSYF